LRCFGLEVVPVWGPARGGPAQAPAPVRPPFVLPAEVHLKPMEGEPPMAREYLCPT